LAAWHGAHDRARLAAAGAAIPAHARIETYSVLTRLTPPHRLPAETVADLLDRWFPPNRILVPPPRLSRAIVRRCCDAGVEGGAVYDGLVGLTATEAGRTLVTRDSRAVDIYRRLGIDYDLLPGTDAVAPNRTH
jgi:hypothetical protein